VRLRAETAEQTRAVAVRLAGLLRAGDLLVLSGDLGAGKTTFTQGLGEGLGVRGDITSPTFVISRVHPSLTEGPALVHVDAYRLGGLAELDDLDLDTSLDEAVTVVEWGTGLAESLAEDRLEVQLVRAHGDEEGETRTLTLRGVGPRWAGVDLGALRDA
jgi:tRNA threonylcarbamoyladenosine biosynthesis protein TsaE